MLSHIWDRSLEYCLDLVIRVITHVLLIVLQEVQIRVPEVHLRGIVAKRALIYLLGLDDGLLLQVLLRVASWGVGRLIKSTGIHEEIDVGGDIGRIDRIFAADLPQHLHILLIMARSIAHLKTLRDRSTWLSSVTYILNLVGFFNKLGNCQTHWLLSVLGGSEHHTWLNVSEIKNQ